MPRVPGSGSEPPRYVPCARQPSAQRFCVVRDRATGRVIGSSRYYRFNEKLSEVEIGWTFLARSHWGGRYNGEMKQLMLNHAFQFVKSVFFIIGSNNLRSQKAIEKIGAGRENVIYRIRRRSSHEPRQ